MSKCGDAYLFSDEVKVVFCSDCMHSRPLTTEEKRDYIPGVVMCMNSNMTVDGLPMFETDFCSYGEMKDVEGLNNETD